MSRMIQWYAVTVGVQYHIYFPGFIPQTLLIGFIVSDNFYLRSTGHNCFRNGRKEGNKAVNPSTQEVVQEESQS